MWLILVTLINDSKNRNYMHLIAYSLMQLTRTVGCLDNSELSASRSNSNNNSDLGSSGIIANLKVWRKKMKRSVEIIWRRDTKEDGGQSSKKRTERREGRKKEVIGIRYIQKTHTKKGRQSNNEEGSRESQHVWLHAMMGGLVCTIMANMNRKGKSDREKREGYRNNEINSG